MAEIKITKDNFEKEVNSSKLPVLLDLRADWCGPCNMLTPIIKEISEDYEGRLNVGIIDVDSEEALAVRFGVNAIPMLVLMKDGKILESFVGFRKKNEIAEILEKYKI